MSSMKIPLFIDDKRLIYLKVKIQTYNSLIIMTVECTKG